MPSLISTHLNGSGSFLPFSSEVIPSSKRFSDIPIAIDIPVSGVDLEEAVEVNLEELLDDPTELCTLLENENASKNFWMVISLAYAKQQKVDLAIEIVNKGLESVSRSGPKEKLGLLSCLCWLFLWKSREAPRVVPDGQTAAEAKTKDFYLQAATGSLNEASRVNPSFPPLFLARGILSLLRASLQPPTKSLGPRTVEHSERIETLRQALKCFDDASRASNGRNMMALFGKGRALFSLGKFADALECYQEILMKMPDFTDPDPRVGIGCCLWQLSYREEAREAWDRAAEINPHSKIANILLATYYVHESNKYPITDPSFATAYKTAMTVYTQKAFKIDKELPLTCVTFGSYFLAKKGWATVENLARKAIELTDVNAIASDGWHLLARKEHCHKPQNLVKASDFYSRADNARGGGDRGFLPARIGSVQVMILNQDFDGAKFRLERIVQYSRNFEAMTLLGTLYARDIFNAQSAGTKEDNFQLHKKTIAYLEAVRLAWKDPHKGLVPDTSLLVTLARLYEADQPEKSLQCLLQVEQLSIEALFKKEEEREKEKEKEKSKGKGKGKIKDQPEEDEDVETRTARLRLRLAPALLNNIGCFQHQSERYEQAKDAFEAGLNACKKLEEKVGINENIDRLLTTSTYNLGRTCEAAGLLDDARQVYNALLARHAEYTDAKNRLTYIELRQNPSVDGPRAMAALYEHDSSNLEVRSLFGWYLSKAKKRAANIAEDQEQRHYKHTLQHHDKHDRYALTGMGNLYLTTAREMRRDTEQDKEKRRKMYEKAVEFYDKALQLDAKNAYAAQGVGIALAEDKKDFGGAVQVFSKLRETLRDASVFVNLGHVYGELKQYSRAIESYEAALGKDRANDPQVLACLGRVWLLKGKQDKSASAMKKSLEYSQRALETAPEQVHFEFNIAFVQFQLAQLVYSLAESQRTLQEVQSASESLDQAIESFINIAHSKNPPYPKHDIEQRANMGRNTLRRQLERAVQQQKEYEDANATKLQAAKELREAEIQKREEERRRIEGEEQERKRKLAEERQKMLEVSRELAEKRAEEERRREEAEFTTDSETGDKVKRKKKKAAAGKRKKKTEDEDGEEGSGVDGGRKGRGKSTTEGSGPASSDEERAPKKRRKLARKNTGKAGNKMKSSEMILDSDEDADMDGEAAANDLQTDAPTKVNGNDDATVDEDTQMPDADNNIDDEDDEDAVARPRKNVSRRINDDDDDDDDDEDEDEDEDANEVGAEAEAEDAPEDHHPREDDTTARTHGKGNIFADPPTAPMVNETVAAAGDEDTAAY